jgi:hypothetical protein
LDIPKPISRESFRFQVPNNSAQFRHSAFCALLPRKSKKQTASSSLITVGCSNT